MYERPTVVLQRTVASRFKRDDRIDARRALRREPDAEERDAAQQQRHADEHHRIARGDAEQERGDDSVNPNAEASPIATPSSATLIPCRMTICAPVRAGAERQPDADLLRPLLAPSRPSSRRRRSPPAAAPTQPNIVSSIMLKSERAVDRTTISSIDAVRATGRPPLASRSSC